jgi:hypothetical protein
MAPDWRMGLDGMAPFPNTQQFVAGLPLTGSRISFILINNISDVLNPVRSFTPL